MESSSLRMSFFLSRERLEEVLHIYAYVAQVRS